MKNLIFGLIATVFMVNLSWGQVNVSDKLKPPTTIQKAKLYCITESCCSAWIFTIEIYSVTTCHYVSTKNSEVSNMVDLTLNKNVKEKFITVKEDVVLPPNENGEMFIMSKGSYEVVDGNKISFSPVPMTTKATQYCYTRTIQGHFMGHEFNKTIEICVTLPTISIKSTNHKGLVQIDLTKNSKLTFSEEVSNFSLSEDVNIIDKEKGINYLLKRGEYKVNKNGKF